MSKPIRVTAEMIDKAVGVLGCMEDEMCDVKWQAMTCARCRDKTKAALEAVFTVVAQRKKRIIKENK